jgi:hypothetical protein
MVMAGALSEIFGLQTCTTLVFVGIAIDWLEDLMNQSHGPALHLRAVHIAVFAKAESRARGCSPIFSSTVSANQFAVCNNVGIIPPEILISAGSFHYLAVGSGAGTVESSLLIAKSRV